MAHSGTPAGRKAATVAQVLVGAQRRHLVRRISFLETWLVAKLRPAIPRRRTNNIPSASQQTPPSNPPLPCPRPQFPLSNAPPPLSPILYLSDTNFLHLCYRFVFRPASPSYPIPGLVSSGQDLGSACWGSMVAVGGGGGRIGRVQELGDGKEWWWCSSGAQW